MLKVIAAFTGAGLITMLNGLAPQALSLNPPMEIAQTDTAAAFYARHKDNVAAIPLPDCAASTSQLTQREMQEILLEHNRARQDADRHVPNGLPPLPAVSWNCDAAAVAQAWADQSRGTQGHSADDWRQQQFAARTGLRGNAAALGENLAWAAGSAPAVVQPVVKGVTDWDDERQQYNHSNGDCSGVCGHYTQIVWRESTQIGCGIVRNQIRFPEGDRTWPHGYFLNCTYHHVGNMNGDNPLIVHPDWYYR